MLIISCLIFLGVSLPSWPCVARWFTCVTSWFAWLGGDRVTSWPAAGWRGRLWARDGWWGRLWFRVKASHPPALLPTTGSPHVPIVYPRRCRWSHEGSACTSRPAGSAGCDAAATMTARNGSPPSEELHSTERQSQRERETKKVLLLFYVLPCFPATFSLLFFHSLIVYFVYFWFCGIFGSPFPVTPSHWSLSLHQSYAVKFDSTADGKWFYKTKRWLSGGEEKATNWRETKKLFSQKDCQN